MQPAPRTKTDLTDPSDPTDESPKSVESEGSVKSVASLVSLKHTEGCASLSFGAAFRPIITDSEEG